jgi:hypothetical protein
MRRPVFNRNSSAAMCGVVPTPPDAKLMVPGRALAISISSWIDLAANDGLATSTSGEAPSMATPATSRGASKVVDLYSSCATA